MPYEEAEFFTAVNTALHRVTGVSPALSPDTFLCRDLGLESIALVDFAFELSELTGLEVSLRQMVLASAGATDSVNDVQVKLLIAYLEDLAK